MKCIACDQWEAIHDGGLCDLCKAEGMPTWYDLRDELTGAGELEAALREIRDITHRRHAAVSWLQHKDGLEAIEAIVQTALGESTPPDSGGKGAGG